MKQEASKMVRYTRATLPSPTEAEIERLKRLEAQPDSEIDTSDIPVWTEEQWKTAVRGGIPRATKR